MTDFFLKNLISIQHTFGIGTKRSFTIAKTLFEKNLLNCSIKTAGIDLFSDKINLKIANFDYKNAENIIVDSKKRNIKIITYFDEEFPSLLKEIPIPPILIFVKGKLPDFEKLPAITIVGPREPSAFGKKAAFSLGFRLARAGMIVVSGGALGVDSAAHKGAISAEGITVCVLGCGIDSDYLSETKPLREKITNKGCLISEYPPLTPATKFTFPIRNRILSGLSLGSVIVEAGEKSGALITARHALDQGRDVFVIPGNPTQKEYKGSNSLLRDGAKPLIDTLDIFNEYLSSYCDVLDIEKAFSKIENKDKTKENKKIQKNIKETLSKEAKIVYNYLDIPMFCIDDLSGCGLSADLILSALTELELENLITPIPGGKYKVL